MKKSTLLRKVSANTGIPYATVKKVVDSALEHIADSLSTGERVVLSGFGTFALRPYRARQWVNPQTGQEIDIPSALRPGFITSAALKRRLAGASLGNPQTINLDGTSVEEAAASMALRSRRAAARARQGRASSRRDPAPSDPSEPA